MSSLRCPLHLSVLVCMLLASVAGANRADAQSTPGLQAAQDADASQESHHPNVLLICIDDLRNELGYLGSSLAKTPALDRFAATAVSFSRHYVQVPTCGASRAALMRGRYPSRAAHIGNNAIAATHRQWAGESLPGWFSKHGYQTYSLGKVTHYPGNLTGQNWNAPPQELPGVWTRAWIPQGPWPHAEAIMHGYAGGKPRRRGQSPPLESASGSDHLYPDAWVADAAITTLQELHGNDKPWFFAVGFFKPHLPFAAPQAWFDLHDLADFDPPPVAERPAWPSGWHASGEFRNNYGHQGRDPAADGDYARQLRRAYAASVSYMDHQVGRLLEALDALDPGRQTHVVIWGDHGFLLGEHGIWGKHCLYEEALRSPLMIRAAQTERSGALSDAIVETVDLFPTLADLCDLPAPPRMSGQSLRPWLENPQRETQKPALSFWTRGSRSIRTDRWRLIEHPATNQGEPVVELFDYQSDPQEAQNLAADHPQRVTRLRQSLAELAPPLAGDD